jgi:hypothetical protein
MFPYMCILCNVQNTRIWKEASGNRSRKKILNLNSKYIFNSTGGIRIHYSQINNPDPDLDPVKFRDWRPGSDLIPTRTISTIRGLIRHRCGTMEESREQCTVVFALIVTKPASECVCLWMAGVAVPPPPPPPLH